VLDPARLRIDLPVFLLGDGDDVPSLVEHDEARACRALVYGSYITRHYCSSLWLLMNQTNLRIEDATVPAREVRAAGARGPVSGQMG
ncbi:unnamed protein product, partial [Acidocella sp. C78]